MSVGSDELTDTEKDMINIYGESRILKTIWCFENDEYYKNLK